MKRIALILCALIGCRKTSTIDCPTAIVDIEATVAISAPTPAHDLLKAARHDILGHECSKREWDQKTIGCLSSANSLASLAKCTPPSDVDLEQILSTARDRAKQLETDPAAKAAFECVIDSTSPGCAPPP